MPSISRQPTNRKRASRCRSIRYVTVSEQNGMAKLSNRKLYKLKKDEQRTRKLRAKGRATDRKNDQDYLKSLNPTELKKELKRRERVERVDREKTVYHHGKSRTNPNGSVIEPSRPGTFQGGLILNDEDTDFLKYARAKRVFHRN